jgi:hypothetical protein
MLYQKQSGNPGLDLHFTVRHHREKVFVAVKKPFFSSAAIFAAVFMTR